MDRPDFEKYKLGGTGEEILIEDADKAFDEWLQNVKDEILLYVEGKGPCKAKIVDIKKIEEKKKN